MKGFAMYQTAFELRNGLINNKLSKLLYSHVVGHGLTIRADYITKINGFSSNVWCEDIYLTGLLFNNGIDIIPLTSMDKCKLVLDDDIEISLPIEEYLSGDKVEKVKQEDGTYSILLKDVSEVIVK